MNDVERWLAVRDQLREGLMPPEKEPRPDPKQTQQIIAVIEKELTRTGTLVARPQPQFGNEVPHADLFDPKNASLPASTPARYWRLSPFIYRQYMTKQHPSGNNLVSPFNLLPGNGFRDYALPLAIDEPVTALLWLNAESLVNARLRIDPKTGKVDRPQYKEIGEVFDEAVPLTDAKLTKIVTEEFRRVLGRQPTSGELTALGRVAQQEHHHRRQRNRHAHDARRSLLASRSRVPEGSRRRTGGRSRPTDALPCAN